MVRSNLSKEVNSNLFKSYYKVFFAAPVNPDTSSQNWPSILNHTKQEDNEHQNLISLQLLSLDDDGTYYPTILGIDMYIKEHRQSPRGYVYNLIKEYEQSMSLQNG